jgi:hypothetical protein
MKAGRSSKRKGRLHGAAMMGWLFFANLFDPKKAAAIEQIQADRRLGSPAERAAAFASARPNDD